MMDFSVSGSVGLWKPLLHLLLTVRTGIGTIFWALAAYGILTAPSDAIGNLSPPIQGSNSLALTHTMQRRSIFFLICYFDLYLHISLLLLLVLCVLTSWAFDTRKVVKPAPTAALRVHHCQGREHPSERPGISGTPRCMCSIFSVSLIGIHSYTCFYFLTSRPFCHLIKFK
jgi:hypothetical protein